MSFDRYVLKKRRNQLGLTQQEVADKAGINIKQYQRFETGERELTDASFMTVCKVLKALEMDMGKYATGEYEIKELLYRGHDGRIYSYETDEPIEICLEAAELEDTIAAGEENNVIVDVH